MKPMSVEKAKEVLSGYFTYPTTTKNEAARLLERYWSRVLVFEPELELLLLTALQSLSCEGMGEGVSVKRQQRARGRNLRKKRTGSRK